MTPVKSHSASSIPNTRDCSCTSSESARTAIAEPTSSNRQTKSARPLSNIHTSAHYVERRQTATMLLTRRIWAHRKASYSATLRVTYQRLETSRPRLRWIHVVLPRFRLRECQPPRETQYLCMSMCASSHLTGYASGFDGVKTSEDQ